MATRLLLRSFRFRRPPPPAGSSHLGNDLRQNLFHRSPPPPVPPRTGVLGNIRWFRGGSQHSSSSSSKTASPGRRVVASMLYVSIVSLSADLLTDYLNNQKKPPKGPQHNLENMVCTGGLVAVNVLVHVVDVATKQKLSKWGAKNNDLIRKGQLWRLATSSLLHCGIIHITLNMFALDDIGSLMEEVTSPGRFLAIYCTSALAGSLMSYRFVPGNSVGASDAIYGLFGAQGAYTWRRRESLTSARDTFKEIRDMIIFSLAFSLALRLIKVRIDNWAHLGGFLGGAAVELVLGPHEKQHVARIGTMTLEDKESELCA
ncbi:unnamed protein product [Alopecurus aequalis]